MKIQSSDNADVAAGRDLRAAGAAQAGLALTPALPNEGCGCQEAAGRVGSFSFSITHEFLLHLQPLEGLGEMKWDFMWK